MTLRHLICTAVVTYALTAASLALAQSDHSAHMAAAVVQKIDKAKGTVTLSHGPLPNGMAAMTMVYKVKTVAWLDKMAVGQKIRFATDPKDGDMTAVRFEPVKP